MKTYIHKLTRQKLTIKKDLGEVCSCHCDPYVLWGNVTHNVIICLKENLIELKESTQQKLF